MHKLIEYVCDELKEYEEKVGKGSQLSMQDLQIIDTLAHTKKNLMKCDQMEEQSYRGSYESGSYRGSYNSYGDSYGMRSYDDGGAYARGRGRNAARDSMGRYSSDGYARAAAYEDENRRMKERLKQIMSDTPDERTRRMLQELAEQ